jgi:adenylate cyclase
MKAPPILTRKVKSVEGGLGVRALKKPAAFLLLVCACVAFLYMVLSALQGRNQNDVMVTAPFSPVVMILPFKTIGGEDVQKFSQHFVLSLTDKLTAFDSLNALSGGSVAGYEDWSKESDELGQRIAAQYVIQGTVRENFYEMVISILLLDLAHDTYVWSNEKVYDVSKVSLDEIEADLTDFIAGRLGSPYGVIQSFEPSRMKNEKGAAAEAYRCVLSVYQYANNQSLEKHAEVRACLEESVERFPQYVEAWSLLSYLYIEEVMLGYNPKDFGESAARRAMKAAQRAIEIDPRSARAHQNMSEVAKLYGDEALLRRHIKAALLLNPNDSEVLANSAWSYGELGEWDKAQMYAEKAVLMNLGHPRWYHGIDLPLMLVPVSELVSGRGCVPPSRRAGA